VRLAALRAAALRLCSSDGLRDSRLYRFDDSDGTSCFVCGACERTGLHCVFATPRDSSLDRAFGEHLAEWHARDLRQVNNWFGTACSALQRNSVGFGDTGQ
jgi:hypothetical protein